MLHKFDDELLNDIFEKGEGGYKKKFQEKLESLVNNSIDNFDDCTMSSTASCTDTEWFGDYSIDLLKTIPVDTDKHIFITVPPADHSQFTLPAIRMFFHQSYSY